MTQEVKIGLALGGGGAKGFALLPILEVFDELGIRPCCITGTSIGAIIGALYASGHSAKEIVEMIQEFIPPKEGSFRKKIKNKEFLKGLALLDPHISFKPKGLLKGEKFLTFLYEQMQISTFDELKIPLKVVATDFWRRKQKVFSSGDLLPALRASMAIPYVFTPVVIDQTVLVDGGLVNNVPVDLLDPSCTFKIAVNISGKPPKSVSKIPSPIDAIFYSYEVMQEALVEEKLKSNPVDLYICPPLVGVNTLDFHKAHSIYTQGLQIKDQFKQQLETLLENKKPRFPWFRKK